MNNQTDLNTVEPVTDGRQFLAADNSTHTQDASVFFRGLEHELLSLINRHDLIVGCVAWLTHERVLQALANKGAVSVVVQKEDFLRPDVGASGGWKAKLRRQYECIENTQHAFSRQLFEGTVVPWLNSAYDDTLGAGVRCVGNHNSTRSPAFPRMHNKFLVFGNLVTEETDEEELAGDIKVTLSAVWTGSFNLTKNATMSLENAVVLRDPSIVSAYYREWGHIYSLSEPLDWESDWTYPEFRIGT